MKKLSSLLIALLFVAGAVVAEGEKTEEKKEPDYESLFAKLLRLKEDGETAFQNGQHDVAVKSFETFIEVLPTEGGFDDHRAHAHYYIACSYSLKSETKQSIQHLDLAMKNGLRQFDAIEADSDLANIRNTDDFRALVAKYQKMEMDKIAAFDFDVETIDGKRIAKKDFLGKVLVVDIWGTWCGPCVAEIPHFIELQKKYGDKGLQIVGLNNERGLSGKKAVEHTRSFYSHNKMNYPCGLASTAVMRTAQVVAFPTTLFIGRDGRIRKKIVGGQTYRALEKIVLPLLAEKPAEKKPAASGS